VLSHDPRVTCVLYTAPRDPPVISPDLSIAEKISFRSSDIREILRRPPLLGRSFAKIVRMTDTAASEAARLLVAQRWGSQRPTRLARELLPRLDELPAEERSRLLDALRGSGRRD
jgi:hypothetical protein